MLFCLTGCATIINKEYEDVEVLITREYYKHPWKETTLVNQTPITKMHNATYCITVKYMNKTYNLKDEDSYSKYSGKVGETVIAVKEDTIYDDGSIKSNIIKLK